MLGHFGGQRVCLVGMVTAQSADLATITCSGGHSVQVQKGPGSSYGSQFVEVVGIAAADGSLSVREERAVDMGDVFDLQNYDQVVGAVGKPREATLFAVRGNAWNVRTSRALEIVGQIARDTMLPLVLSRSRWRTGSSSTSFPSKGC